MQTPERLMLVLDSEHCPTEAFDFVNSLTARGPVTVILLEVIRLNIIAPEGRIYRELAGQAERRLESLAAERLRESERVILRVRRGQFADQVLAESRAQEANMIVLESRVSTFAAKLGMLFRKQSDLSLSRLARQVLERAPCSVVVIPSSVPGRNSMRRTGRALVHQAEKGWFSLTAAFRPWATRSPCGEE